MPSRNFSGASLPSLFFLLLLFSACGTQELPQAVSRYKTNKDYASLEVLYSHLHKGMTRSEVDALLGKPDYSPITGQEYYSSDRRVSSEETAVGYPVGLITDYRDEQGRLTRQLQTFRLAPIGE